jgi:hypothetical protein
MSLKEGGDVGISRLILMEIEARYNSTGKLCVHLRRQRGSICGSTNPVEISLRGMG